MPAAQNGHDDVAALARRLKRAGHVIAVAESLTGGELSARLASGPDASEWFMGGVVAYTLTAKRHVLGYDGDEPVSVECAVAMAEGVRRLFHADVAIAVTGVGGPDPQGGKPPGTVWLALSGPGLVETRHRRFAGSPDDVVLQTCHEALVLALEHSAASMR